MNDDFRLFKLSAAARLIIAGALYAGAIALQFFTGSFFLGVPLFFTAWAFLAVKAITNKPDDQGFEEWKPVSMKEVDRLYDNLRKSKELKPLRNLKSGCPFIIIAFSIIGFFVAFGMGIVNTAFDSVNSKSILLVAGDLVLMFFPLIFFGNLKVFIPAELDMKTTSFYTLISEKLPSGVLFTPYFRFDKDSKGKPVPEDIRFMLELKRKPDDFMGVQFQIAINNGPHGAVPYMYAVILTRGKDVTFKKVVQAVKHKDLNPGKFIIEQGGDREYGTVVIRQETGGGGYHTNEYDVRELNELVIKYLKVIAAA